MQHLMAGKNLKDSDTVHVLLSTDLYGLQWLSRTILVFSNQCTRYHLFTIISDV